MGKDAMPIGQFHPEHRIRQQLDHGAFYLN